MRFNFHPEIVFQYWLKVWISNISSAAVIYGPSENFIINKSTAKNVSSNDIYRVTAALNILPCLTLRKNDISTSAQLNGQNSLLTFPPNVCSPFGRTNGWFCVQCVFLFLFIFSFSSFSIWYNNTKLSTKIATFI